MESLLDTIESSMDPVLCISDTAKNVSIPLFGSISKVLNSSTNVIRPNPAHGDKIFKLGVSLPRHFIPKRYVMAWGSALSAKMD